MQAVAAAVNGQKPVSGRGRYSRTRVSSTDRRMHQIPLEAEQKNRDRDFIRARLSPGLILCAFECATLEEVQAKVRHRLWWGCWLGFLRRYYSKQPRGTNEGSDLTRNGHVSALCKLKTVTRGRCQSGPARSWRIVSQDQGDRPMSF